MALSASADGSMSANGAMVELNVSGFAGAAIQLTGTWTATVSFTGSVDGVTFSTMSVTSLGDPSSTATSATSNGVWQARLGGISMIRATMSSRVSGTALCAMAAG